MTWFIYRHIQLNEDIVRQMTLEYIVKETTDSRRVSNSKHFVKCM